MTTYSATAALVAAIAATAYPVSVSAATRIALLPESYSGDKRPLVEGLGSMALSLGAEDRLLILRGNGPAILADVRAPTGPKAANTAWRRRQIVEAMTPAIRFIAALPEAAPDGSPTGSHLVPQEIHAIAQNLIGSPAQTEPVDLLVLGSWAYFDPKDARYAMIDGYYPSDAHFSASLAETPFGTKGLDAALRGLRIHYCWPGGNQILTSEEHGEALRRVWSVWTARQSGEAATFSFDLATCLLRFQNGATTPPPNYTIAADGKLEMRRVRAPVPPAMPARLDEPGAYFMRDDAPISRTPPTTTVGVAWIGLKWLPNADIDLYARAAHVDPWLFFGNARTESGFFNKDFLNGTGQAQFEYIEFTRPIDLTKAEVAINLYVGDLPASPEGVVRVWFGGRIYEAPFKLKARSGNRGQPPMEGDPWLRIDLRKVVGLPSS